MWMLDWKKYQTIFWDGSSIVSIQSCIVKAGHFRMTWKV